MSLLDRIKTDALAARKAQGPTAGLLVTLIGEAETRMKTFSPARAMTDEELLAVVKKFLKNIEETLKVLSSDRSPEAHAKAVLEKTALEVYLPAQLSAAEIEAFASAKIAGGAPLGAVMAALKAEHGGHYDGKLASEIVKGLLSK